ncbi:MAG: hypothetical protein A2234_04815 [Elusimicrobia bacterium RIFOXYA2_FULL_58_8]|nr:MAG: hypothetical protein A2234_04815 [Elusimicrobia bacterium RIFOXYA2_FULL_58_8]
MMEFVFRGRALARRAAGGNRLLYAQFRNHAKYGRYWEKHLDAPFGKVGYLPLYELVSLIYREFRLFAGFPGEAAFLSRFMDAVMTLETQGVTSSRSFIEYASGVDEDKAAVFSIALPEYIDAVRVMTFHKSKGLGFSVVINLIYEERGQPDPMYFEEKNGEIRVYHITKAAAEASARLGPVYEGRRSDSHVQELNTLYVISTRARHELYNLVLRKARKSEAREPKLSDLFETFEAGRRAQRVPVARKASSPVDIASAEARAAQRFDALRPTCNSFFEKAEGELVHAMLARLIELPADPAPALAAGFEELRYNYPFMFDKAKLLPGLLSFLTGHAARPLFAAVPGRLVLNEAEFIDKAGALFRVDRVIIDADAVTAVDFKTGGEDVEKHSAQLLNYLGILREVYSRPARGVLAYVDLQKMVEVPAVRPQKEKNV